MIYLLYFFSGFVALLYQVVLFLGAPAWKLCLSLACVTLVLPTTLMGVFFPCLHSPRTEGGINTDLHPRDEYLLNNPERSPL